MEYHHTPELETQLARQRPAPGSQKGQSTGESQARWTGRAILFYLATWTEDQVLGHVADDGHNDDAHKKASVAEYL